MAFGQSAEVLFRIKADSSQAQSEIKKVKGDVGDLGNTAALAGGGFSQLAGPAAAAGAAIVVAGTAALTAAVALFNLTKAAAAYGAAIFDASQKTGLTSQTISALKYAADTSGASLNDITSTVAKFNVLLGESNQGNEKARATLEKYGVTASDVDGALTQAISTISKMTAADQKAVAAKALFADETAKILPIIQSFDGNLPALISKLERLGIVMSDEDARAADEFTKTLDTLTMQGEALGRQFATELMPAMVTTMKAISDAMAENKGMAREWGNALIDTASGVAMTYTALKTVFNVLFQTMTYGMASTQQQAGAWASALRIALAGVTAGVSELIFLWQSLGAMTGTPGAAMGGSVNIPSTPVAIPPPGGGGGGRGRARAGGGGGSGTDDAERKRQAAVRAAEKQMQQTLAIYAAGYKEEVAQQEQAFALKLIKEDEYQANLGAIRKNALENHKQLLKNLSSLDILNAEERADIAHDIAVIDQELATERIENATKVYEVIKKLTEQETRDFEDAQEKRRRAERKRANDRARLEVDPSGVKQDRKTAENEANISILGDSVLSIRDQFGDLEDMISPALPTLQLAGDALAGLAQGIGNVVQNLVLMGSTGPNAMKKMVASVLAGVAAQAAVLAVMELAYGIAALTPWGAAVYGPAAPHFKAAALFGAVAVGTGLAGRAVAGDSFSQAAGGATGSGATNTPPEPDAFTTNANNPFTKAIDRMTMVNAQLEETVHNFQNRIEGISTGEVVRMGAPDAADAIFDSVTDRLGDVGAPAAGKLVRGLGWT